MRGWAILAGAALFALVAGCAPVTPDVMYGAPMAVGDGRRLWDAGATVRVRFIDGDPALWEQIERTVDSVNGWNSCGSVFFDFDQEAQDAEIRVTFEGNEAYACIAKGCLASMASPGRENPNMGLATVRMARDEATLRRMVLHEFGHVLGLYHEHQHPNANIPWDEGAVYAHYGSIYGWSDSKIRSQILRPLALPELLVTEYDTESVMHYPFSSWLFGDPTFHADSGSELSEGDRAACNAWYSDSNQISAPERYHMIWLAIVER